MGSYEEDQGRITLANLGSYLDMTEETVHGLYCICRLLLPNPKTQIAVASTVL